MKKSTKETVKKKYGKYGKNKQLKALAEELKINKLELYNFLENSKVEMTFYDKHNWEITACPVCGKDVLKNSNAKNEFCSDQCEEIYYTEECPVCGKDFVNYNNNKTCSKDCATILMRDNMNYQQTDTAKETIRKKCHYCGETFTGSSDQKYCSEKCRLLNNTNPDYYSVFYRDGFRCRYCGRTPADGITLTIDHVYPQSKGGGEDKINLVTACRDCNSHKGATKWEDERIKEIWWQNKKLSEKSSDKSYEDILEEFKAEYPDKPMPTLLGGK